MKKVIICILLLIPILVILTIDASGKLIASALVDIQVEWVAIKNEGQIIKTAEIDLDEYKNTGKKYNLFADIFPGIATTEMVWTSSDNNIATVKLNKDMKSASVTFLDYGSVSIACTSSANSSVSARVTFYVTGNTPHSLSISDYSAQDGFTADKIVLPRYAQKSLLANVKPAKSVKGSKVKWSSSDTNVAVVDANGIIDAVGMGNAIITAEVTAKGVTVQDSIAIEVADTSLLTKRVVYTSDDSIDISTYFTNPSAYVEGGNVVNLATLIPFERKNVEVKLDGETEILTIVKLDVAKSLVVKNLDELKMGALSKYLAIGTSNVQLEAVACDNSEPNIVWKSTNPNVVKFNENNGRLFAMGSGKAEVYAEANGYQSERIEINVATSVDDFILSQSNLDDYVGLKQERVFGNISYIDGSYTKTLKLSVIPVSPENAGIESFTFESDNPDVAQVDKFGNVTFADDCEGKSVTIIVVAYNSNGIAVSQLYTYHLVNGVNVGFGHEDDVYDGKSSISLSFDPYFDLKTVAYASQTNAIVLHSDVYYPSIDAGGETLLNVMVPIYGNGHKLDGQLFMTSVDDDSMLLKWDFDNDTHNYLERNIHDVKLVNLNLQATQPTSEDSEAAFIEMVDHGGGAVGIQGAYKDGQEVNFLFDHCLFQYAYRHVNLEVGNSTFNGCIFRNNSASAIVLQQSSLGVANAVIRNCIFSNTIAPVGITCGSFDDVIERFNGGKTKPLQWGTLSLEGENYVYNWKKIEEIQMNLLPSVHDVKNEKGMNALIATFNKAISNVIKEAFAASDPGNLYMDENEQEWLNFSFLLIGIWENINPQINTLTPNGKGINVVYDKDKYETYEVLAYDAPSVIGLKGLANSLGCNLEKNKTYLIHSKNTKGEWNTKPGETYTIGKVVYDRLNGIEE